MVAVIGKSLLLLLGILVILGMVASLIIKHIYAMQAEKNPAHSR